MSCKQIPFALLMRLADGELRGLKALTLRRHLKCCKDCTQTLSELGRVDMLLQNADYFPPEPKHKALPLRPIGFVSGVALAAGAALFFAMPGSVVRPAPSFAQVEEAMRKIKTVHWTETSQTETWWTFDSSGVHLSKTKKIDASTRDCWSDLEKSQMAKRSILKESDDIKESKTIYYLDEMIDFYKSHDPKMTSYVRYLYSDFRGENAPRMMIEQIILPEEDKTRIEMYGMGNVKGKITYSGWKQSEEVHAGKKILKFVRRVNTEDPNFKFVTTVSVWVDKETMRVIRRESVNPVSGEYPMEFRRVAENFCYDETPPPGVFELPTPKVGERYIYVDRKMPVDHKAIRAVVSQAIGAYSRRDHKAFLALWDFEAIPQEKRVARRELADAMIRNQAPYRSWKAENITSADPRPPIYVRKSESDPFPPIVSALEDNVDVNVVSRVTTEKISKPYLALATFTLTKRSGQWKIQQLQLSKQPLGSKQATKK